MEYSRNDIIADLEFIYDRTTAEKLLPQLEKRIQRTKACIRTRPVQKDISERDVILITYGDTVLPDRDCSPLLELHRFLKKYVGPAVNTVHILPFFPYTSDDGFSITDYRNVDSRLGTWEDLTAMENDYRLMVDLVANHVSQKSEWFVKFLADDPAYHDFFITVDPAADTSSVFRPRTTPLLSEKNGQFVWTTFSPDQVDLNYANPDVLMAVIDILFTYVERGASFIRLDAVAFIWKEPGTSCIHHPKTHRIIKLFRKLLEISGSNVKLITETNVPHKQNISYFGNGCDEASLVYNFPLPPLVLYTFMKQSSVCLTKWAQTLETPSDQTFFFNFLASHDGIGLLPVRNIVPDSEIRQLAEKIKKLGGFVSEKTNADGTKSPYELNINYFEALGAAGTVPEQTAQARFMAAQSIMLVLKGIPGIYFHSLIGAGNWTAGPQKTGRARSINREKFAADKLSRLLEDPGSRQSLILAQYRRLLSIRNSEPCFSPRAEQTVLSVDPRLFALVRHSEAGRVLCITNISDKTVGAACIRTITGTTGRPLTSAAVPQTIAPYEILWIKF
jgi:sucrose phosphorylase